ncbi:hypothetical protein KHA94_06290 [Bacillus sp. FJAT-49705]|uniref:3D domain-containing protein n=1 Tax=Cytobacillus citreus TaxID=2833586 RepID=A0ABS5NPT6_9BACI|nr:hypothetical protein [Cytobacillus citreus]MBS4189815.1 hypothetical protein [Cytobacillus citreus]
MKKFVISIVAALTLIGFNFYSEASAASKHTHSSQDVTAYVGSTCGHGCTTGYKNSQFNTVAVHKDGSNIPYIPFGTTINLKSSVLLPYVDGTKTKSAFTVTDTGGGPGKTDYWIDIYYGEDNSTNRYWANKFGTNNDIRISYTAYY